MVDSSTVDIDALVFGVDALSHDILSRLPSGTAPTIESLVEDGVSGPLESQLPPWTPSAWPSIYTGVNPGKHGIYGFLRFEGYDWDVVNSTDIREHTLWELLSQQDRSSVVVNAPVTHPPPTFDGALIPGYIAPEDPECHPEGLLDEVRDATGEYRLYNRQLSDGASKAERIDGYETVIEMRGRALRYLLERERPDMGFIQFQQSDTVFHEFPEDDRTSARVYEAIDSEIEATLEMCDPDAVVLVSDHGIGPYDGYEVRPNTLLREQGFVETSTDSEKPAWTTISKQRLRNGGEETTRAGKSAAEAVLSAAASVGITSQRMGAVLERLHLDQAVLRVVPDEFVKAAGEHVDFPQSVAYMRDRIEIGIRINLEGREPEGIVPPDEYESVRSELIDLFETLETPDGNPAFDEVLPREEVFDGPYLEDAPDVIIVPRAFDQFLSAAIRDSVFGEPREPWNHKRHGIVSVSGPDIEPDEVEGAHLLDIAPTVLSLLGVPPSDRMDGDVLAGFDPIDPIEYPEYSGGEAETDDTDVESRLADLGYIE